MPLAFLIALVIFSSCCLAGEKDIPPEVAALESSILNARRSIQSGEFEIHVKSNDRFSPEGSEHFWLGRAGQLRQERMVHSQLQVSIFDHKYAYYYSTFLGQMELPNLIHRPVIERLPVEEVRRDSMPHFIRDPRVIMMAPIQYGLYSHYQIDSIIGSSDRSEFTIKPIVWNGLEGQRVGFTSKIGRHYEYDVVPSRDFNIVRWRLWGVDRQKDGSDLPFEEILIAKLAPVGGASIWFPSAVRLQETQGGRPARQETVIIDVSHLHEEIPDHVFTLGFSDLPPKQLVVQTPIYTPHQAPPKPHAPIPPILYWDGEELRPLSRRDEIERDLSNKEMGPAQQVH